MTESSKIYFRELSSNTKQELEELKKILRLLPMKKRNELVDFILKEKEEGPLYLQKEIVQQLTSAYFLPATKQTKARAAFLFDNKKADLDLRKLPDIDAAYPLYIECKAGKIKQIADKISVYAKTLCSLNDMELSVFALEVLKPDTKQERQQKAIRYEKLKEKAAILHNQKCKKDKFYKQLTSASNNLSNGNLITRGLKQIENLAVLVFKPQVEEELPPYTEEDFDKDLNHVCDTSKDPDETLEYIAIMKYSEYTPQLESYIIKSIQNKTCNVQKADIEGDTLLHIAVQKEGLEHLVVALLNNGASIDKENKMGYTPIALAHSDVMKNGMLEFMHQKSEHSQAVRAYIRKAIEEESFLPISDADLEQKFPTPVIRVQDITPQLIENYGKTLLDSIQPYLDEDIQGDDVSVPGQVQKITDQKKLPTQDTSRGERTE